MGGSRLVYKILILLLSRGCFAKSKLHRDCEALNASGTNAFYMWNACFVMGDTVGNWSQALEDCDHFQNGHLATLPTQQMATDFGNMLAGWNHTTGASGFWLGLHQSSTSDEPTGNWYWHLANGKTVPAAVAEGEGGWAPNEPNHLSLSAGFYWCTQGIDDAPTDDGTVFAGICQYDDETKQKRHFEMKLSDTQGEPAGRIGESFETDQLVCADKCGEDSMCHSFGYKTTDGHCLLSLDDGSQASFPPQTATGYSYWVWVLD